MLGALQRSLWTAALGGSTTQPVELTEHIRAAEAVRRISDQRSKLLGLYAPLRVNVRDEALQSHDDFDESVKVALDKMNAADRERINAEAAAFLAGAEAAHHGEPRP